MLFQPLFKSCIVVLAYYSSFIAHILNQATKFAESHNSASHESAMNNVRSCVVGMVATQDDNKADIIELNVKLAEEKDGRENLE